VRRSTLAAEADAAARMPTARTDGNDHPGPLTLLGMPGLQRVIRAFDCRYSPDRRAVTADTGGG
jgi:hypothetical protein